MYKKTFLFMTSVVGFINGTVQPSTYASDLVDVTDYWKEYEIDLCFYTEKNFIGKKLYTHNTAFLQRDAAKALARVAREAKKYGYKIFISDAYRPLSVQKNLWEVLPDERYVANPTKGGRHTRGTAVDITFVDKKGHKVPMPSDIDDMSEKAHRSGYEKLSLEVRHNVLLLEKLMAEAGFEPYPYEWWHYDFKGWQRCMPLDYSFNQLMDLREL